VVHVPRLALVNAVMYDSWPVPWVARFRDPAVAAATSTEDVRTFRKPNRRVESCTVKFAVDSLLEGDGFELPVPREMTTIFEPSCFWFV
jgi:hypothetical protein